jgi:hypothetical protein
VPTDLRKPIDAGRVAGAVSVRRRVAAEDSRGFIHSPRCTSGRFARLWGSPSCSNVELCVCCCDSGCNLVRYGPLHSETRDAKCARCAGLAARRHGVHGTGGDVLHEADRRQAGVAPPCCRPPCSSWLARQVHRHRRWSQAARSTRRIRSALSAAAQPGGRAGR